MAVSLTKNKNMKIRFYVDMMLSVRWIDFEVLAEQSNGFVQGVGNMEL